MFKKGDTISTKFHSEGKEKFKGYVVRVRLLHQRSCIVGPLESLSKYHDSITVQVHTIYVKGCRLLLTEKVKSE